jgi:hypothetical protein
LGTLLSGVHTYDNRLILFQLCVFVATVFAMYGLKQKKGVHVLNKLASFFLQSVKMEERHAENRLTLNAFVAAVEALANKKAKKNRF